MPDHAKLTFFLIASAVLIATPGPAVLYVLARSLSQGRLAGVVSASGIAVGNLVHVVGAAAGVSAIIASSALAFSALKYAGAAYLVYLGLRKILSRPVLLEASTFRPEPLRRVFRQGILVGAFNPKTALFFLSFLPQFADPARGSVPLQLVLFGVAFVVMALAGDCTYGLLSGAFGAWIKRHPAFLRNERYVTGTVFCGLGVAAAFSHPPRTP